ncbi:hypothetical protein WOLCODRAFT_139449 [Wolfiporia cocos MD-104 SS10]|uniref:DUF1857-domain-containing protein n=1 Tax=Wolfiporia cocos (strain MD-104) TaxID=742152 RepID=A0A2H3JD04_WOLCO|nr:hypothetical protein WOLCODRAFT_139449 [Wolfiporia cocos MD-104 SS10]
MRSVAVTLPVNSPDEAIKLTKGQVYEGLKVKARDPIRFVSVISSCEILEEHETGLLRRVQFEDKPAPVHERIEYYPPSQATFTMFDPDSGEQLAFITNIVSTSTGGELFLTFTFVIGENGPLDVGTDAERKESEQEKLGIDTIARTLQVVREMVRTKEIE